MLRKVSWYELQQSIDRPRVGEHPTGLRFMIFRIGKFTRIIRRRYVHDPESPSQRNRQANKQLEN